MTELSNCPFCGKNNVKLNHTSYFLDPSDEIRYFVMCSECQTEGPVDIGKSGAIEAWNTRPEEDKLKARITELEAGNRWIPVEERLPEHVDSVIVNISGLIGVAWYNLKKSRWEFYDSDKDTFCGSPDVTHWRPLPAAPEAQQ